MPVEFSLRLAPVQRRGLLWRGLILALVFGCGFAAFLLGAGVSERPGIPESDLFTKFYYTISLFVLGGVDLGMPKGGPPTAESLLWFAYFAAPALTTISVIEGILRAMAPERWMLRRLRGHVVIAGAGGIGQLCLRRLRNHDPNLPIVLVELKRDHRAKVALRHQAHLLTGDIRASSVLDNLNLERARRVFLLTGDDFANLDAAAKIIHRVPALAEKTVVHVSDLHFLRVVGDTRVARECATFNSHDIAASHLVETELSAHFDRTEAHDVVVIAGFGRFGQSVLAALQERAAGSFVRVIIMDLEAGMRVAVFAEQVGFCDFYEREVVEGDLRDPRLWHEVADFEVRAPVFILGCGNDSANLRAARWVKQRHPEAYVVARTFTRSPFADDLAEEGNFSVFSVDGLVARSMPPSWFYSARPSRRSQASRGS
ncbi:NAD-binding protein [Haliangium ochraceum]|uniref:TrkA-N domain protein n=1 Tax=Haliangium ochraceum (strain DSM 14365 / JCM 11303 / SMP-2) TaxID=502025 RepID=D0LKZ2_HALO1|nr:NAD-binding protein [Haliangium ochraceum]ACY16712.1 TrkA-N domain protein [Haliangium ochraceum DSM 14365]